MLVVIQPVVHIQHHYELYATQCKQVDILINHHAMPLKIFNEVVEGKKVHKQTTLDGAFSKQNVQEFMHDSGVLHAVAQFVTCDNQVWLDKT